MWLKKGHFGLSSQKASVAHSIQLPLEYVGYRFAEEAEEAKALC